MKKLILVLALFLIHTSLLAGIFSDDRRYERSIIAIQNQSKHTIIITINYVTGKWENAVQTNSPIILEPNQLYTNTLVSINKNNGLENYASIHVSDSNDPRHHYLIFGEDSNSQRHAISAHIFDGLGLIFVNSNTNHCDSDTPNGYAYCELIVK